MDAAALADAGVARRVRGRAAARRRGSTRFGARALNTVFQSDWDVMAWPRDTLMAPVSRLPWVRGRALDVLSGRAAGLFRSVRT